MKFVEAYISNNQKEIAAEALDLSLYFLGLDHLEPSLSFFQPDAEYKGSEIEEIKWRGRMEAPEHLTGVCLEAPWKDCPEIWIRNDLSDFELVVTVAHEMYHFAEYVKGIDDPHKEPNAEDFGRFILKMMLSRQPLPIMNPAKHVDE